MSTDDVRSFGGPGRQAQHDVDALAVTVSPPAADDEAGRFRWEITFTAAPAKQSEAFGGQLIPPSAPDAVETKLVREVEA